MADFNYAFSNCMEVTLELSCCKYPDSSQLTSEWNDNWHSILGYMEQVIAFPKNIANSIRISFDGGAHFEVIANPHGLHRFIWA